jgi:hypothetical protein
VAVVVEVEPLPTKVETVDQAVVVATRDQVMQDLLRKEIQEVLPATDLAADFQVTLTQHGAVVEAAAQVAAAVTAQPQ